MDSSNGGKFDTAKWTATINRLLAFAEDPRMDAEARQNYAAKAAAMMTRHSISADQLRIARETGTAPTETAELWAHAVSSAHGLGRARARCAEAVARAMACKPATQENRPPAPFIVAIVGAPVDLDALRTLLPLITRQAELATMSAAANGNRAPAYLASFLLGYGEAVAERITIGRRDFVNRTPGADIVLAGRAVAVQARYRDLLGPYLARQRNTDSHSPAGRQAGRHAGRGADLGDTRLDPQETPAIGQ